MYIQAKQSSTPRWLQGFSTMFYHKNLNIIGQVALGVGYGLYLSFLAPKSQREAAHKWLKEQKAQEVEAPEKVLEVEAQPEVEAIADPWEGEVETINQCFCCHDEDTPVTCLLPPAQEGVEQLPIDYSGLTIRQLKKLAQCRRLSKYSSLTKAQLVATLTTV